jgi:hypothetical protein
VTRTWLALLRPDDGSLDSRSSAVLGRATARADLHDVAGAPLGVLAAWRQGAKPLADAVRMDGASIDPDGAPGWLSLLVVPRDRAPLFDDPAVSAALRAVLAGPPPDVVSTLVRDSTHFAGAVTVRRDTPRSLAADPFARLGRPVLARVGAGLFGRLPAPAGPVIQRYAGQPWPAAGFDGRG